MAFAAAENRNTGITLSDVSLQEPHIKKNVRSSSSFPFIKPRLSDEPHQNAVKIIRKLTSLCCQHFKRPATKTEQKEGFSFDESKYIIRELACELDRVIQPKMSSMIQKIKYKGTQEELEEQEYYILQWAKDVENTQTKQTHKEEEPQPSAELLSNSETKFKKAKQILSDWFWRLRDMNQNSVCLNGEYEETLRDLHKQWKHGESSILPVIDWMVWTVLQSEKSEDSVPRQWVRSKQTTKNTAGLLIPNTVWNWITKSTADVILDSNTANPELLISEDGKSFRAKEYTDHDNWKEFEWKRSQYIGWTCVQAKEGYNTGRHYWEVDVKKKCEWRVGVVKEFAPRKSFVSMNTKKGYWNLRLHLGTVMALTEPVTKLNLQTPSKIGVYLDIEDGHVSFYDAEKRRHIYTFNTDFAKTEKMYPMFGTVETEKELKIS